MASVALLCVVAGSAVWDVVQQRIPNRLIVVGIALWVVTLPQPIVMQVVLYGMLGFAIGIVALLWPFSQRLVGGGDVKLLAVTGLFVGPSGVVQLLLVASVLHGSVVLAYLAFRKLTDREMQRGVPFALALLGAVLIWQNGFRIPLW